MDTLQTILYITTFATYGLGDGITATYMMTKKGIYSESNKIGKFLYDKFGANSVLLVKILLLSILLLIIRTNVTDIYWTTNGILLGLSIGGIIATQANLQSIQNKPFVSSKVILTRIAIITGILFVLGTVIDYMI
jgi:hypothetical protein